MHYEVEEGHILSYFKHQKTFRDMILEAIEKTRNTSAPDYVFRSPIPDQNIVLRWPPELEQQAT